MFLKNVSKTFQNFAYNDGKRQRQIAPGETVALIDAKEDDTAIRTLVSLGYVEIVDGEGGTLSDDALGLSVQVDKAEGCKCMRCWTYSSTVGKNPAYVDLCERCAKALSE